MPNAIRSAALAAALMLVSPAAQAVIVDQGDIETDGISKTVDLWFFSLPIAAETVIVISPLSIGPPLSGLENPELLIYFNDGSLDAADFIVGEDDTPPFGLTPQITIDLAAGDYVFVVSASSIAVGQFGPTAPADLATVAFTYEIGISGAGGNEGSLTCVLEGQLGGSFVRRVISVDNCVEPTQAPEPAAFGLLGLALIGLAGLRARVRAGRRAAPR